MENTEICSQTKCKCRNDWEIGKIGKAMNKRKRFYVGTGSS